MKYLVVVAHPDDEALAAGGTINRLVEDGNQVDVCVMNSVSDIRANDSAKMMEEMKESHIILGVSKAYVGNFPTMHFNVTPEQELVEYIESVIEDSQPDVVITHHPSDLHNDHMHTSLACRTAVRLCQRQTKIINPIKAFYYMEVPSSTDWAVSSITSAFIPNTYVGLRKENFEAKMESLKVYSEGAVLRKRPHPRSEECLRALAIKRGSEIGFMYAEAFEMVFRGEI